MSLKILVIGRGARDRIEVANGHVLTLPNQAQENGSIADISRYHFVLQHLNNPETDEAIRTWTDRKCEEKVIGFSGGQVPQESGSFRFPTVGGLGLPSSILSLPWAAVPRDFNGNAGQLVEILLPRVQETLAALAILCQGYLLVNADFDADGNVSGSPEVVNALRHIGLSDNHCKAGKAVVGFRDRLLMRREEVTGRNWWLKGLQGSEAKLSEQIEQLRRSVEKEWGQGGRGSPHDNVTALLGKLSGDSIGPNELVAKAYCAFVERLGGGTCAAK